MPRPAANLTTQQQKDLDDVSADGAEAGGRAARPPLCEHQQEGRVTRPDFLSITRRGLEEHLPAVSVQPQGECCRGRHARRVTSPERNPPCLMRSGCWARAGLLFQPPECASSSRRPRSTPRSRRWIDRDILPVAVARDDGEIGGRRAARVILRLSGEAAAEKLSSFIMVNVTMGVGVMSSGMSRPTPRA